MWKPDLQKYNLFYIFRAASISVVNDSEKLIVATYNSWQNAQKNITAINVIYSLLKVDAVSKLMLSFALLWHDYLFFM